jgi:hypothetical protein
MVRQPEAHAQALPTWLRDAVEQPTGFDLTTRENA